MFLLYPIKVTLTLTVCRPFSASTPSMQTSSGQKSSSNKSKHQPKPDFRAFVALFDYDPYKMSPNQDSCSEELPFRAGQYIKVYGEQDADGFYYGEASGRSGYIPCNMISEVDDPEIVKQLMNESQTQQSGQKSSSKADSDRKSSGNIKNQNVNSNSSTDSVKTTKGSSSGNKSQQQQQSGQGKQSFVPIGNYQYKPPGPPNQVKCVMIALYDYDPQSLSPNVDVDVSDLLRTHCFRNQITLPAFLFQPDRASVQDRRHHQCHRRH